MYQFRFQLTLLEEREEPVRLAAGPVTSPDQKPPYQGCLSCMSGGRTPVEAYVGIKQAYLGSFGE